MNMTSKLNSADARFTNHFAFIEIEVVDEKIGLWKGKPIMPSGPEEAFKFGFFSRKYDRKNSDIDRMLEEFWVEDESILGVKFLLVPREKVLFAYNPPSSIIKVPRGISRKMGGR